MEDICRPHLGIDKGSKSGSTPPRNERSREPEMLRLSQNERSTPGTDRGVGPAVPS